jgi:phosphoglycerate kinase
MTAPKRPFVMVIGGAKISDKVEAVVNLTHIADQVLVGGGVANNFLKAEGFAIAKSFIQDTPADLKKKGVNYVAVAEDLLAETQADKTLLDNFIPLPKIVYPIDVLAGTSPEATTSHSLELTQPEPTGLKSNDMFLDIGPKTAHLYAALIAQAGTVFWNGPMGVFENPIFATGTKKIAHAIATTKAVTILGGGDTEAAVAALDLESKFDYISTAGGAALEYLAGKELPGLQPLLDEN